jgi:hypothetical protein
MPGLINKAPTIITKFLPGVIHARPQGEGVGPCNQIAEGMAPGVRAGRRAKGRQEEARGRGEWGAEGEGRERGVNDKRKVTLARSGASGVFKHSRSV